jgi:hypothetical protein
MKSIEFLVVAAALVLGMSQPARVQGLTDMAKLTCAQLLEGSANAIESSIWVSGYYNGLTGAVPIQSDKLVARSRPFNWWSKPDVGRQNHS